MLRDYRFMMGKSEFTPPTNIKVGDKAIVLYSPANGDHLSDFECGDTTVVEVKKNGTVVLANKFKFHASGQGHSTNSACWLSSHHATLRDTNGMPINSPAGEPLTARGEIITTKAK